MAGSLEVPMDVVASPERRPGRWDMLPNGAYVQQPVFPPWQSTPHPPPSAPLPLQPPLPPPDWTGYVPPAPPTNPPPLPNGSGLIPPPPPPSPDCSAAVAFRSGWKQTPLSGRGLSNVGHPVKLSKNQRKALRREAVQRGVELEKHRAEAGCSAMPPLADGGKGGGCVQVAEHRPNKKAKQQGAVCESVRRGNAWAGNGAGPRLVMHDAPNQGLPFLPVIPQVFVDQIVENVCEQLQSERKAAITRCQTAEKRSKAASATVKSLNKSLKEGVKKHEAELAQSKQELNTAQAAKEAVAEDLDAVVKVLVANNTQLGAVKAKLDESNIEVANQAKALADAGTALATLQERNAHLSSEVGTIASQLGMESKEPQGILAAVASLQSAVVSAEREVKQLEGDRSSIAALWEEVTNELHQKDEKLEQLEREGLEREDLLQELEERMHERDAFLEARRPIEQNLEEALAAEKVALAAEKEKSRLGEEALRKLEAIREVLGVRTCAKEASQQERCSEMDAKEKELHELKGKLQGVKRQMESLISSQNDLEKRAEANFCLCLERNADTAIVPCGHVMCSVCWESYEERQQRAVGKKEKRPPIPCPICKAEVYLVQPIYSVGLIDDSAVLI